MKDQDFEEFVNADEVSPPRSLDEKVLSYVHRKMNPTGLQVFQKLGLIQLVTGFVTLLFCPQLGVGLTSNMGLMNIFMRTGDHVCMACCGALFLSLSMVAAVIFLRPEELRVIRQNQVVQIPVLALATLGVFICFGAPVLTTFGIAWFAGSVVGAASTFQAGLLVRNKIFSI